MRKKRGLFLGRSQRFTLEKNVHFGGDEVGTLSGLTEWAFQAACRNAHSNVWPREASELGPEDGWLEEGTEDPGR